MNIVFKIGPSKICGRQSLKNWKGYGLLQQMLSYTNFTWSTLEYFVLYFLYRKDTMLFKIWSYPDNIKVTESRSKVTLTDDTTVRNDGLIIFFCYWVNSKI